MPLHEQLSEPETLLAASTVALGGVVAYLKYKNNQLKSTNHHLTTKLREAMAKRGTDELTDLPKRRILERAFEGLQRSSQQHERNTDTAPTSKHCLLVFDLDGFKAANDSRGHNYGNEVLVGVAGVLNDLLRERDVPARIGGDEFAALIPRCDIEKGFEIAESLREGIASSNNANVTSSIGITEVDFTEQDTNGNQINFDDHLHRADQAMYAAKHAGRNQVFRYDQLTQ